jgi:hypothetical protein
MVHQFDHRYGTYLGQTTTQANQGTLPNLTDLEHADPAHVVQPRYWVARDAVKARLSESHSWLLGFRDITSTVTERTVVAGAIPHVAVGNKFPIITSDLPGRTLGFLLACLSSFVFDYVARQKLGGTTLNFYIFRQLPALTPEHCAQPAPWDRETTIGDWVVPRVLELTFTASDLCGFAKSMEYDGQPFRWDGERRAYLKAELDACFFHLYSIGRDDVEFIMSTFWIVEGRDEAAFGEYRTARLILERYDEMSNAIESGVPYRGMPD